MQYLLKLVHSIIPSFLLKKEQTRLEKTRYRRIWIYSVVVMFAVSLTPLIIMTVINYHQYKEVFTTEVTQPLSQLMSNTKRSLEFFIEARISALTLIINERDFDELTDQKLLIQTFSSLKKSFKGFIDIGIIDSEGNQRCYVGPYELEGKNYKNQSWFQEVNLRDILVSEVFMGYRKFPHFVIAIKHEKETGDFYVLRATIDTKILDEPIRSLELRPNSDAFIINRDGILQTESKFYGEILKKCLIDVPSYSPKPMVEKNYIYNDDKYILGYAYIEQSPFILMIIKHSGVLMENWFNLRTKLLWFLVAIILIVSIVILWRSTYMVDKIYEADRRQAKVFHDIEYTNKMATLGRLAAGIAHEINNPLAIINEKGGLLKDLATFKDDFSYKEKTIDIVKSILNSVERCSKITHRLLGFAKRMDVHTEKIDLESLLRETLGFLGKETVLKNICINFDIPDNMPSINSDRGQLQQVFLNIINNAIDALPEGGHIEISMAQKDDNNIAVTIKDDGHGISEEDLKHIFEPFFTTKKEYGTGLGLSITYGIIKKLGGNITAKSELGEGTSFSVTLPIDKNMS